MPGTPEEKGMIGVARGSAMLPLAVGITFIIIGLSGRPGYVPYGIIFIVFGIIAGRRRG
jgi:hypothetical protein